MTLRQVVLQNVDIHLGRAVLLRLHFRFDLTFHRLEELLVLDVDAGHRMRAVTRVRRS